MKNPFKTVRTFFQEMVSELRKATWPTRAELRDSTVVVIIAIALIGVFTGISDFSLTNVVTFFTNLVKG